MFKPDKHYLYNSHTKCRASTGICDNITAGQGKLDENGYWEIPCPECALKFTRLVIRSRDDDALMDELSLQEQRQEQS